MEDESVKSYRDLKVYQRSMAVLVPVHRMLLKFPEYEKWEMASQMRRASKSVPMNIAEGYGKKRSAKNFKAFLDIAMGSANEMAVSFGIAKLLEYAPCEECDKMIEEYEIIGKQLNKLIQVWQ